MSGLEKACCCVVAFGGSEKTRRLVVVAPLITDVVDDNLWKAGPSLNVALREVSYVTHCSLVNSFLHSS